MTNYNERLDEVLQNIKDDFIADTKGWQGSPYDAKQAITSLIKELVAEAKPEITFRKPEGMPNTLAVDFGQRHLDDFEQNLLKALEEV